MSFGWECLADELSGSFASLPTNTGAYRNMKSCSVKMWVLEIWTWLPRLKQHLSRLSVLLCEIGFLMGPGVHHDGYIDGQVPYYLPPVFAFQPQVADAHHHAQHLHGFSCWCSKHLTQWVISLATPPYWNSQSQLGWLVIEHQGFTVFTSLVLEL